ncbi:MAG: galactokinase [Sphingomonas sp.]
MTPRERTTAAFAAAFGEQPARWFQAPGRVNLIGEHTDYNDGFVLPCVIDRQTVVAWGPASDGVTVVAADANDRDAFATALPIAHADAAWANYARGVADELLKAGHAIFPARLAIAGDVPLGAGLSSSASLEVAVALALTGCAIDPLDAALLCQRAENLFVGCNCGIMDQMVSAAGTAGHALLIDCRSLARRPVRLPSGCAIVVIDSGMRHVNTDGGYNARRTECERAAAHYGVAALRDLDEATLNARRDGLDPAAYARARHVVTENARVLAAADALAAGDLAAMGVLMAASHRSMRDDFQITVPAIDRIVAIADGVIQGRGGARMTGGGFGGSVVALVPSDLVRPLIDRFDGTASVFTAAAGASEVLA